MKQLFNFIESENIYLDFIDLTGRANSKLFGLYLSHPKRPIIVLDVSLYLPENRRLYKCVLAEELGHHFCTPRTNVLQMFGSCSIIDSKDKILQAQDEFKALVWASNILMPDIEMRQAISDGCKTTYDLAEFFDVTEWFVYRKLGIVKAKFREKGFKLRSRDYFKEHIYKI